MSVWFKHKLPFFIIILVKGVANKEVKKQTVKIGQTTFYVESIFGNEPLQNIIERLIKREIEAQRDYLYSDANEVIKNNKERRQNL